MENEIGVRGIPQTSNWTQSTKDLLFSCNFIYDFIAYSTNVVVTTTTTTGATTPDNKNNKKKEKQQHLEI